MENTHQFSPPIVPQAHWLMGHYRKFKKDPLAFLYGNAMSVGPLYRFKVLHKEYVVATHPEAVRHILVNNVKKYTRVKSYSFLQELLGQGLLTTEGDGWRKQRRLTQPIFSRDQMQQLMAQMDESIIHYITSNWGTGGEFDLEKEMNVLTLQILTQSILYSPDQKHFGQVQFDLHDALVYMTSKRFNALKFMSRLPSAKKRKGQAAIARVKVLIDRIISERKHHSEVRHNDLLEMLMSTRDEETGEAMNDQALRDEVMTMFVAGHDTTAAALTWVIYLLDKNPQVKQRMLSELVLLNLEGSLTMAHLNELPYMKMVIQESMRLLPSVWAFGRKAKEEDEIMGMKIMAGQSINIPIYCVHRHPEFWERPNEFYPEHFLPEAIKARDKFAYMPFSLGQHRCIGEHFALMEIQMVMIRLYRQFDIQLKAEEPLTFLPLVTLKPLHPISFQLKTKSR
jgi:cytochrome P450